MGVLGEVLFNRGRYVYVGSAQWNLEKRVERHLRKEKKIFWHIDYLLGSKWSRIEKVFFKQADKSEECVLANELGSLGDPVAGFGCSDCRCQSHLFWFPKSPPLQGHCVFPGSVGWSKFDADHRL